MWRKVLVLTLAVVLVGVAGFGQVKNPDTMIYLPFGSPESLDPHYAYDTSSSQVIFNTYDSLIRYDHSRIDAFLPMISLEVPTVENGLIRDGGKTIEFPLREGVKFHSGNTLTPEDVAWSIKRGILFDRSAGPMKLLIEALSGAEYYGIRDWFEGFSGMAWSDAVTQDRMVKSAEAREKLIAFYNEVVDPIVTVEGNSVVFHLNRSYGPFLFQITHYSSWASIIDSQWAIANGAWDGKADGWWRWNDLHPTETPLHTKVAGSGPYKLVEWDQGNQRIVLERFEDYWQGPAPMKNVIIWGVDEFSTRKAMLLAGDADLINVPNQFIDQFKNIPGIRAVTGFPLASVTNIHMNWGVDPVSEYLGSGKLDGRGIPPDFFTDIHVRRAIIHLINYDAYMEDVLSGLGKMVPTDMPEGYLGYDDTLPKASFNLALAERELKQAWDGKLWEVGFVMPALYNTGNMMRQTGAEMLKVYMESLNPKFKVNVIGLQWATYLAAGNNNLLPLFFIGWSSDYPDPHDFIFTYYHSQGTYSEWRGEPYRQFLRENTDALIEEALFEPDFDRRAELYRTVQEIVIENVVASPLYMPTGIQVMRDWVDGWWYHPMRSPELEFFFLSK